MKKMLYSANCFLVLLLFLVSANLTSAQQISITPISPEIAAMKASQSKPYMRPSDIGQMIEKSSKSSWTEKIPSLPRESTGTAETLSEFEQFITGGLPEGVSTEIKQFGYDLFSLPTSSFAADRKVPVGPGYILGPGDEVRIAVWGKIEGNWNVVVDRDGNISLPKVGVIGVTGLTFSEAKVFLHKEFLKYYTGFKMNISMGALKTINVYVVGNATRPGAYTLSSLSTLVNALMETGGPSKVGTMRDIQLKRNGQTIARFDMYDFLLSGDKSMDKRLMSEDVIFIPPVGHLVGIAGNVKKPAIYELFGESRLLGLIKMSGGLTSIAFKGRVQRQRIEGHQFVTLYDGDIIDIENNEEKNFILKDGDLIKIFSVIDTKNTVILSGAVVSEGEYAIEPGITRLKDVIAKSGGLLYYASSKAELTRVTITQSGPATNIVNIDISKAMEGDPEHNLPLEINDYIFVRTIPEWSLYRTMEIKGEVRYPGTYSIRKGETLTSVIERAGGYTDKAYLRGTIFTREQVRIIQQKSIDEMIERLDRDMIAEGAVRVSTALTSEEIEAKKVELEQQQKFIISLKGVKATGRMAIKLAHPRLLKNSEYDIELEEGDTLYIPVKSSIVNVVGSVMSRGSFVFSSQLNYKDYIEMSGGVTKYADEDRVYVLKVDGTAMKLKKGAVKWSSSRARWEMSAFSKERKGLEPGDSIVVPEKLDRIAWMREIKDLTQILYQIAVTAGVAVAVF